MVSHVCLGEYVLLFERGSKPGVPLALTEAIPDLVNGMVTLKICHIDLIGGDSNNGTMYLMQRMDELDTTASNDVKLQRQRREFGKPRTGDGE